MHRNATICLIALLITSGLQAGIFSSSKKCEEPKLVHTMPQAKLVCENETDGPIYVTFSYVSHNGFSPHARKKSHPIITLEDLKPYQCTKYIAPHSTVHLCHGHTSLSRNDLFLCLNYTIHDANGYVYNKAEYPHTRVGGTSSSDYGLHRIVVYEDENNIITTYCQIDTEIHRHMSDASICNMNRETARMIASSQFIMMMDGI